MPRLVRQHTLRERLSSSLNLMDLLLWLSEELETRDWNSKSAGTKLGLALNLVFLVSRAYSGSSPADTDDDVFGNGIGGISWVSFVATTWVWLLAAFSVSNALYAITRSRTYRLFEANIEHTPGTPSAHRVRVQSTPVSSSPLRLLTSAITVETAESRAHPDKSRDVWEVSVWDPLPMAMGLLGLFSPVHVLIYALFLPILPMDSRPSVTVLSCMLLQALVSGQLLLLQSQYSRQAKDHVLIQREVMHEYNTKYVHPRLHPVVRDVATQVVRSKHYGAQDSVHTCTPTSLIRRGFHTNPNQNYYKHYDPDGVNSSPSGLAVPSASRTSTSPRADFFTPVGNPSRPSHGFSRPPMALVTPPGPPAATRSMATSTGSSVNFGGSMGVYTHFKSPLKEATSLGDMHVTAHFSPRNCREMAALEQSEGRRQGSPTRTGPGLSRQCNTRFSTRPQYERYPSLL